MPSSYLTRSLTAEKYFSSEAPSAPLSKKKKDINANNNEMTAKIAKICLLIFCTNFQKLSLVSVTDISS